MPRQRYSKTDHRYWVPKIFKPKKLRRGKRYESPFWCVRLQHETGRTTFPLQTSNREAAAARARDVYVFMLANGWEATLREFKSGSFAAPAEKRPGATIGEFLDELSTVADLKPKTFRGYSVAFRTIVAQIFRIDGGKGRHYSRGEAREQWLAKIHAIKLADVTPQRVQQWKREFLSRAGSDPTKLRTAKVSVNSLIRRAKSLFAPDAVRHLQTIGLPDPLPLPGWDAFRFD